MKPWRSHLPGSARPAPLCQQPGPHLQLSSPTSLPAAGPPVGTHACHAASHQMMSPWAMQCVDVLVCVRAAASCSATAQVLPTLPRRLVAAKNCTIRQQKSRPTCKQPHMHHSLQPYGSSMTACSQPTPHCNPSHHPSHARRIKRALLHCLSVALSCTAACPHQPTCADAWKSGKRYSRPPVASSTSGSPPKRMSAGSTNDSSA